jgi:hypothetical protein
MGVPADRCHNEVDEEPTTHNASGVFCCAHEWLVDCYGSRGSRTADRHRSGKQAEVSRCGWDTGPDGWCNSRYLIVIETREAKLNPINSLWNSPRWSAGNSDRLGWSKIKYLCHPRTCGTNTTRPELLRAAHWTPQVPPLELSKARDHRQEAWGASKAYA